MSKLDPTDIHSINNFLIEVIFGQSSFDALRSYISPHLTILGTAEHERIVGIEAFAQLVNKQNEEMSGMTLEYKMLSTMADTSFIQDSAHLMVQEIQIHFPEIDHSSLFRLSSIWVKQEDHWLLFHCHSSTPDQNISEHEAWPIEGIMQRNRELEEKIDEKTAELKLSLQTLKDTQSQLIHSEKMASLGELTAGIAHEIQNPLNFVNNFSEINKELIDELKIALDKNDQEEINELIQDLIANEEKVLLHGKRAEAIVKSMLSHSRTSEGTKEQTDINALCNEYLRLAYHGLRAKNKSFNAEFDLDLDPNLPTVKVIPQDIGRVLLNLINNAFQAVASRQSAVGSGHEAVGNGLSPDGSGPSAVGSGHEAVGSRHEVGEASRGYLPRVVVRTRYIPSDDKKDIVTISITDNGPGIPEEIREKIFQPFFSTKPTGEGTGLGLSLAYDIVKAHGGEITVNSEEGKSAEFKIKIPIVGIDE